MLDAAILEATNAAEHPPREGQILNFELISFQVWVSSPSTIACQVGPPCIGHLWGFVSAGAGDPAPRDPIR